MEDATTNLILFVPTFRMKERQAAKSGTKVTEKSGKATRKLVLKKRVFKRTKKSTKQTIYSSILKLKI
jgi:hypothetical protein